MAMPSTNFEVFALTPPNLLNPGTAIAASRAGHAGLLDLEYSDFDAEETWAAIAGLAGQARGSWGVKIDARDAGALTGSWPAHSLPAPVVVLTGERPAALSDAVATFRHVWPEARLLVELASHAALADVVSLGIDAILAKGHEAGGRTGDETSFLLMQRLVKATDLPVIVQGGVGRDTVASMRAAGAAGVALDWQLALIDSVAPAPLTRALSRMDGSETNWLGGGEHGVGHRVFWRPDHAIARDVAARVADGAEALAAAVAAAVDPVTGGGLWLIGQDAAFARGFAECYARIGEALDDIAQRSASQIALARQLKPLARSAPLAQTLGTEFPIVQGPMTRVSDRADFALAVADGGALPFLALALMRHDEASALVAETKRKLGDRPWGVGILGFVDDALREEQTSVIAEHRPGFALIAGGRPEQAASLEAQGIRTFLHAPSPGLLTVFLQQGSRRFVLEGRECGGHVGPRTSAVLWQQAVDELRAFYGDRPMDCEILFAGGIHDAHSAAVVSALGADLAAQGAQIGVLVGTGYIITEEACRTGAVVPAYQQLVLDSRETVLLESGVGHATRVVRSPILDEFFETKARLTREGIDAEEIRDRLERLNVGRSRIASKGIDRNPDYGKTPGVEKFVEVSHEDQLKRGLYMIGQAASLHDSPTTIAELHGAISDGSGTLLDGLAAPAVEPEPEVFAEGPGARIAITGIATLLPGARNLHEYWRNILDKVDAVTEVPERRWDWRRYFDEDRDAPDKAYSLWGGFVDEIEFDPIGFGIPPKSMTSIEPLQLLALQVVREALESAGFADGVIPDAELRRRTCVVIGVGGGAAPLGQKYAIRSSLDALVGGITELAGERLPEWTEDSFPGILLNVIAGRVANRFDLGGVNFTVDAACGSSLAAVMVAAREIETGSADMAIVGGVDAFQSPFDYVAFSKTGALSPRGRCRTFDASADGIAIAEGLAVMVLRRLDEAEAAGDRIFAVIRGVAGSSDGRDLSLTAPRPEGQQEALRRAYRRAGVSPGTIGLVEAHGTGTVVGDRTEIESLSAVFARARADRQYCGVGSVKSMIGHTKAAAGCAGMAKVALALHHGVLPPTLNVVKPNESADFPSSPFYVLAEPRPWLGPANTPRRAGVSAFGFGGTNFHAVLEEYRGGYLPRHQEPFRRAWTHELLLFSAADPAALAERMRRAAAALDSAPSHVALRDVAASLAARFRAEDGARFALVTASLSDAAARLTRAASAVADGSRALREVDPSGAFAGCGTPLERGDVAFLFPGQGSQYPGMAADLAMAFPEVRAAIEAASSVLDGELPGPLGDFIYPRPAMSEAEAEAQAEALKATNVAQPAIGAVSAAICDLVSGFGLVPGAAAGHSFGELSALSAAGAFDTEALVRLAHARGDAIIAEGGDDLGTMIAVNAGVEAVQAAIGSAEGVTFANINAPDQTVLAGSAAALDVATPALEAAGLNARRLPVACAFHSDFVAPAQARLGAAITAMDLAVPDLPVYGNETAMPYPSDADAVRAQLTRHLTQPVDFLGSIEAMHDAGTRLFVEVGPNAVLTRLAGRILGDRPHLAVATDVPGRGGLQQLLTALGAAAAGGLRLDLSRLWAGRADDGLDVVRWSLHRPEDPKRKLLWMVDPANVRPIDGPVAKIGLSARIEDDPAPQAAPAPARAPAPTHSLPAVPAAQQTTAPPHAPPPGEAVPQTPGVAPAAQTAGSVEIMRRHQALMESFLDSHRQAMELFLTGRPGRSVADQTPSSAPAGAVSPPAAEPTAPAAVTAPRVAPTAAASDAPPPAPATGQAPASASPAPPIDAGTVTERLLDLIADRTGYPTDMLGTELNLEADLGIDSIKRVEILAALRLEFLSAAGEAAHERMGPVSREKTVTGIVARFLEVAEAVGAGGERPWPPAAEPAAPAAATGQAPASASPAPPIDAGTVTERLLDLIADRTGYPTDMLGTELNLEADLGIDSIKRVEILAALRLEFLSAAGEAAHERMGPVSREKTVTGIVARFLEVAEAVGAGGDRPRSGEEVSDMAGPCPIKPAAARFDDDKVRRFVMVPHQTVAYRPETWVVPGAAYALTADRGGVSEALAERIRAAGGHPHLVAPDVLARGEIPAALTAAADKVAGIFHCAALLPGPVTGLPHGEGLVRDTDIAAGALYRLLAALGPELSQRADAVVVAATAMGGAFGFDGPATAAPGAGSAPGLLKTVAKEWPLVHVRAVDLAQEVGAEDAARLVFEEAGRRDDPVEIGWQGETRLRLLAEPRPLAPGVEALPQGAVLLVTGGARGITARTVLHLARSHRPHFVIVGSVPLPETPEPASTASITDTNALRARLIADARAEGGTIAIPEIERRLRRLIKQREIRGTLESISQAGATAEYRACNVRDGDGFAELIDAVYDAHGRIDGVIHGAGVIEDRLIIDKTPESFDRVVGTKVDSAITLARCLRSESLKFLVFFTSVAGRFGNRGQGDYGAANEAVSKLARQLDALWPMTRVVAMSWGPWDQGGMVSEEVKAQFEALGIEAIPPELGVRALEDEILNGPGNEPEVVWGLGPWADDMASADDRDVGTAAE